jgi:hypothetical protein
MAFILFIFALLFLFIQFVCPKKIKKTMKFNCLFALLFSAVLFSCEQKTTQTTTEADTTALVSAKPKVELVKVWETDTLFTTCESALFDEARNVIYVSNINGMPTEKDGNGFISKLKTDGTVENLKWITGLNAPKGLGLIGNKLYVTDITDLVEIDIEKGKITKKYPIKGAVFLNDVTVDTASKTVYFSDMKANVIHTFSDGKLAIFTNDTILGGVNGLLFETERLLFATFGDQKFKSIDYATKAITVIADSIDAGDGVVNTGKDAYLVSSWTGEIFFIENGVKTKLLDTQADKTNSADIGFIPSEKLVLVPTFFKNTVVAYKLVFNE